MSYHRYKLRDFDFAQLLVDLRKKARFTQDEVARQIGVSAKAIRNWEGGSNYPADAHLRKLIELYLHAHAFPSGQEQEQAHTLWDQCHGGHISSFDELWFARLLAHWHTSESSREGAAPEDQPERQAQTSHAEPPHALRPAAQPSVRPSSRLLRGDWSEALDVSSWYGRTEELATLSRWLLEDRCRLVSVLGIGGIGKTTLTVKLVQQVAPHFACVLWCSLYNAPSLEDILQNWLPLLADQHSIALPQNLDQALALVIGLLQERRCLLVLDNLETIFHQGSYREGYEGYATLIRQVAQTSHQSCLVLTSRELFLDLGVLAGRHSPVRVFRVPGLSLPACQLLLQDKGLFGEQEAWRELVERYSGNPLALKIVAETVQEFFDGDIAAFLNQGFTAFHGIRPLLTQQFERLSSLEQTLLYWLAIERELISLETLHKDLWPSVSAGEVIEAMYSLRSRSLVERGEREAVFTLQPVVLEYVTERLVMLMSEEICQSSPALLLTQALLQGKARDYARTSQARLLVQPVLDRLLARFGSPERVEAQLEGLLPQLRLLPRSKQGYGGGNIVNLLARLNGHLRGKDCSHLTVWQANLQETEAQDTSFAEADLAGSVFMELIEGVVPAALSPDGQFVAAGTFTGQIQIWHALTGQPLMTLQGHTRVVWTLAFNAESTLLVSGGFDNLVKVWEVSSGQCVGTLRGHSKWIRSVAFHPGGELLATSSDDGSIRLWDLSTNQCREIWHEQDGGIWSVAFSPDGRLLASGDLYGVVRLWEVEGKQCRWTGAVHQGAGVAALAFSQDSQILASGAFDNRIQLLQARDGAPVGTLAEHSNGVHCLAFGPEDVLVSGSFDHTVKLWQVRTHKKAARCLGTLQDHSGPVYSTSFGPDGLLITSSLDSSVKLWRVSKGGQEVRGLRTLRGYALMINAIAFSPDGKLLVSSENNGTVRRWETSGGQCLSALPRQTGGSFALAFSPDQRLFAGSTPKHTVRLWDAESGQHVRTLRGHRELVLAATFSPDGRSLVSGSVDVTIKVWEVESGQCSRTLQGHQNWVWSLAYSPDGRLLASGDGDGVIKLWEISSGTCLKTLRNAVTAIPALTFTPDGRTLLSCHERDQVSMWDVESGACLRTIQGIGEAYWVQLVNFSADSSLLATASRDRMVQVWDMRDGRLLRSFPCQAGQPWAVAWSADGQLLAYGTDEGTILVWEWQTERCLVTLRSKRPYEGMHIRGTTGLTEAQVLALKTLGATD